jgi:protein gp37
MAKGSEKKGCLNCYAARLHTRNLPGLVAITGTPLARRLESGPRWTGVVGLNEKMLMNPFHWRRPRRIFVNSQSDLFHEGLTFEQIDEVIDVMVSNPWHTYQVLTKRAGRLAEYFSSGQMPGGGPLRSAYVSDQRNILWGVSIEDQATAAERLPLVTRARVPRRFVSYEPALGPVDLSRWLPNLDWVIMGGESGPGAREMLPWWVRDTRDQCQSFGVPFFFKQWGGVQKKKRGAMIDGREWREFPIAS